MRPIWWIKNDNEAREIRIMEHHDNIPRTVLPIPDQPHVGLTTYDAKDPETKYPPIRELRPPSGAPNVLEENLGKIDELGWAST